MIRLEVKTLGHLKELEDSNIMYLGFINIDNKIYYVPGTT